jgi:16S rRNA processing protein RimM
LLPMSDGWIAVGKVIRAVGLEGNCVIDAFGTTLELIDTPFLVMIGKSREDIREFTLEEKFVSNKALVCHFGGIDDRDTAEQLRGLEIFIDESTLPKLEKNEFYHYELEGMDVFTDHNETYIGKVSAVHNFPATDSLEVEHAGSTVLIPMNRDSIVKIDRKAGRITVNHFFVEDLF